MQAEPAGGKTPADGLSLTGEDRAPGAVGRDPGEMIVVYEGQRRRGGSGGRVIPGDRAERDGRLGVVQDPRQELRRGAGTVNGAPEEPVARGIEPDDALALHGRMFECFG